MTEIKTVKAWGAPSQLDHERLAPLAQDHVWSSAGFPVHIVSGLSDSEAAALPEIMERAREVCRWEKHGDEYSADDTDQWLSDMPNYCPSCGRKVKVVE